MKLSGICHFSSLLEESEDSKKENLVDDEQTTSVSQLPMDEDMEDILEHIEEDVDLPDEDEDEELEETEMNIPKKELEPSEIMEQKSGTLNNGFQSHPALPKLPPLPPLPPPLLNLEFLKVTENLKSFLFCFVYQ